MNKIIVRSSAACAALWLFAGGFGLGAQEVDRAELEKSAGTVDFINYEGPYARIDTRAQIRAIGYGLGLSVRDGALRAGTEGRYFVIHAISEDGTEKLNADIIGLGPDAGVDHIRNLRLIMQGYLEGAYNYTASDAALLAEFVTIYNAVYRGNWNYFEERYKAEVMKNQDVEKAGISVRFDEWPGRTLMFVPLGSGESGALNAIDTGAITGEEVIEELRTGEDMGVPQRESMADLKEREADETAGRAQAQVEEAKEEGQKIEERREQLAEDREALERDKQNPAADPEKIAAREEELARQEEELSEDEAAQQELQKTAEKQQEQAEQKREEAQQERQAAEEDSARIAAAPPQDAPSPGPYEPGILAAIVSSRDSSLGQLVTLSAEGKQVLNRSPVNTINLRTLTLVRGKVLAIAGQASGSGGIRLVEISADTLETVRQGDDDIAPTSLLWLNGADLYAIAMVTADASGYEEEAPERVLARFDLNLVLQASSAAAVHPYAAVTLSGGNLLTQRADGTALVLDPKTLEEK
ncbi:MAG: hypothetical protein LBR16_02785 [Treponema sp.]|jgi:hypothetical protein|nr:hypothetical protein [Treponema sp.]